MNGNKRRGASIRIFLVDGSPQGLRLIERFNWTGSCLAFARADYLEARAREELGRTGVYVLVGPDPDGKNPERIYIGEGEEVRIRIDSHQKEKDFWTRGYVLSTNDQSLNKAHVRYLESRFLQLARAAATATVDNGTSPPLPRLSESETADMENFLEDALPLLSLVGVSAFEIVESVKQDPAHTHDGEGVGGVDSGPLFFLNTLDTFAEGRDESRGFVVEKGARARKVPRLMNGGYKVLRDRLITEGVLIASPDGTCYELTKTYVFESPSAAASVLAGGSKNGRTEWKDSQGKTLKAYQEESAQ